MPSGAATPSVIVVDRESPIDTGFDFRSDTPVGQDPDRWSPTLRSYHRRLWSKPLPGGTMFRLDGMSSDAVVPTYRSWAGPRQLVDIVQRIDPDDLDHFQRISYSIGAMLVFPATQIGRQWTINQARGMLAGTIGDRLDLTLECIRRHYLRASSPLGDVLARYGDFFGLFGDFRGYVDFFLLDDLTTDGCSSVEFLLPFGDFATPALPQDVAQYKSYRRRSIEFVAARNSRIASVEAPYDR